MKKFIIIGRKFYIHIIEVVYSSMSIFLLIVSTIVNFYNELREQTIKALKRGALDIFVSSMLNKVLMLVANIWIIRLMEPSDFGVFSYVYNIITIIMIVSTIGVDQAMMQFCCENRPFNEKRQIEKYTFKAGVLFNIIFSIITILYSLFIPLSIPEAKWVLISFAAILPVTCVLNYQKYILRIRLENRKFAILTNVSSFAYLFFSVALIKNWDIAGAVAGRYLGFLIPIIVGYFFIRNFLSEIKNSPTPSRKVIKSLLKYGLTIAMTNGVSELLYYLDVYVVGIVTTDTIAIANYKSATLIPRALATLPSILMVFIYPYFAYNKDNLTWIKKNVILMQAIVLAASIILAIILYLTAPWLIDLLYGASYAESVTPYRILVVSFVFSAAFRIIAGNVLAMLGKVDANFVMACIECVLNVILDFVLIYYYGAVGAAIATLSITIISSLMCNGYLFYYIRRNIQENIL